MLNLAFDFERNWCRLFQKRVVRTKFDFIQFLVSSVVQKTVSIC